MPVLYRIVKAKYSAQAFDGEGARLNGGRWNSPGSRVVYTSATASLATLEILVHVKDRNLSVPSVIIPNERNYLLNPQHRDFQKIRIGQAEAFEFDPRLTV